MNSAPLVSIVIPAFNSRFFQRALQGALIQRYSNLEVIVCDDSRGDDIRTIFETFAKSSPVPMRYVRNPQRLGFIGNLRECLAQAQGEFIKFLCDDDQIFASAVSAQVEPLMARDDVSLVLSQRLLWDADDIQLPSRMENSPLSPTSALFKGEDLMDIVHIYPLNFLGGLSSALFRRDDVLNYLPGLTQSGHCFAALLDLALYVCMMRRGNVVVLNNVLGVERLHPERLSRQQTLQASVETEQEWLLQMIKMRGGEPALGKGWVRYMPLKEDLAAEPVWEELALSRSLGTLQTTQAWRVGTASESFAELYEQWLACRNVTPAQELQLPNTLMHWPSRPKIVPVIIDRTGSRASLDSTLRSLEEQLYAPELTVVLSCDCVQPRLDGRVFVMPLQDDPWTQLNDLLAQLDGAQWFYLLRGGDRLVKPALLMLAERVAMNDALRCVYSDEGALFDGQSAEPVFKPDFNLDLLRSYPYVGRCMAFHRETVLQAGGLDARFGELAPHDLLWRLVEEGGDRIIGHLSEVTVESQFALSHWLASPEVIEQNHRVVDAHLRRCGIACEIQPDKQLPLINRIHYLHDTVPLVSIMIIIKDQLAPLQRCVESLLEKTAYAAYEVLILDHGSESPDTRTWLAAMGQLDSNRLRVLEMPTQISSAELYNAACGQSRGEYVLFLDPYTVVTQSDWLDQMLDQARRPEVGVVGPKMYGPDASIVHAGLILGLHGPAGMPFRGESLQANGYMQRLQVVHDLSAVGPDCLLVRKSLFEGVGGLSETDFACSLSHVDLCLRIREKGYLVVWTPLALLAQGTRPKPLHDASWQQRREREDELFYLRWLPLVARDPAYNPNLLLRSLGTASFSLEPGLNSGWTPFSTPQVPVVLGLPINASAIGHYRVTEPFFALESAGYSTGVISYAHPGIIDVERYSPDIIVLQGRYSQQRIDEMGDLKTFSRARRIYELDDYVIHVPKKNEHVRGMPDIKEMERLVRRGISMCDRVVVSTEPLADALSSMHDDIRVVPNLLTPALWTGLSSQRRTSKKPRVGWGGGTSHTGDLEIIAEVVRELADEVDWVFFGMCPPALRPYIHEFHGIIPLERYPAKLASLNLDLAVAPLEKHIFNDCKSNLRLLEYGACGYPVICTETAAYQGYLPRTSILTNTTAEWLDAIRGHLSDPDASYRQGDALREAVERDFMLRGDNLGHWVNGWLAD
ncbi:glycosyltransferase [Pseudomonas sp. NFR16]|uniref:glycosyltransferase n=1 Tax=Pseudomonas sp. NFR16 TaxID=1566248 RepID=UPI0008D84B1F|nr:glycosyltransferase [Pseudomonas sp. NFR16]SEI82676.1 Glycosyltransferase, GT2 family [Pseudomonas sp. NFR16]